MMFPRSNSAQIISSKYLNARKPYCKTEMIPYRFREYLESIAFRMRARQSRKKTIDSSDTKLEADKTTKSATITKATTKIETATSSNRYSNRYSNNSNNDHSFNKYC